MDHNRTSREFQNILKLPQSLVPEGWRTQWGRPASTDETAMPSTQAKIVSE
jgi:hypothetical protein